MMTKIHFTPLLNASLYHNVDLLNTIIRLKNLKYLNTSGIKLLVAILMY